MQYDSNSLLVAVRHISSIEGSAMQSQLYECSNGHLYVVKLPGNKQGRRCIANDYIGTMLAKMLNLPTFSTSFIHVIPELLPDKATFPNLANLKPGIAWGTLFHTEVSEPKSKEDFINLTNRHLIPWVIAFDHWVLNWDRANKMANILLDKKTNKWYLIDHGIAFTSTELVLGALRWNIEMLNKYQNITNYSFRGELYDQFVPYVRGSNPFDKAIKEIQRISKEDILEIMDLIPDSWKITSKEKKVFARALIKRAENLPEILNNSKDYYTGWK
ncbi:HipA family kinase [Bacillus sp. JJ1521]|uniref:HipA family kinase n=1 Tax=Bacillus sp. JJ1521 TaxID=3122957 RepID=UPI002FFE9F3E